MKFQHPLAFLALVALGSCGPERQPEAPTNNGSEPVLPAPSAPPAVENSAPAPTGNRAPPTAAPEPGTPGGLPDVRTPLPEPRGPIDPKSAEAAGQVVQHYAALIEQGRYGEAEKLWGDQGAAGKATKELKSYAERHMQIGKPTDMEGAAGSIYIEVPVVLYGKQSGGKPFHRSGNVILRRVNDVPGSTEQQRRWHIERIEWSKSA
jgi:hypothetical protein